MDGLYVLLGMVVCFSTLASGLDYGTVCAEDADCSYTGGVCVKYTGCEKGTCKCDRSDYLPVLDGGKMVCKTATVISDGDACDKTASAQTCERNSGCGGCPAGDAEENIDKCRSLGSRVALAAILFVLPVLTRLLI